MATAPPPPPPSGAGAPPPPRMPPPPRGGGNGLLKFLGVAAVVAGIVSLLYSVNCSSDVLSSEVYVITSLISSFLKRFFNPLRSLIPPLSPTFPQLILNRIL